MAEQNIKALVAELASPDGLVRRKARLALVDIGIDAVPALVSVLKSPDEHPRWEAAKALSQIGDPSSAPALVQALTDEVFDVRWLAAEALKGMRADETTLVPLLKRLAIEGAAREPFLREGAHHILKTITRGHTAPIVKPVVAALESNAPASVPPAADQALDKLRANLKTKDTAV